MYHLNYPLPGDNLLNLVKAAEKLKGLAKKQKTQAEQEAKNLRRTNQARGGAANLEANRQLGETLRANPESSSTPKTSTPLGGHPANRVNRQNKLTNTAQRVVLNSPNSSLAQQILSGELTADNITKAQRRELSRILQGDTAAYNTEQKTIRSRTIHREADIKNKRGGGLRPITPPPSEATVVNPHLNPAPQTAAKVSRTAKFLKGLKGRYGLIGAGIAGATALGGTGLYMYNNRKSKRPAPPAVLPPSVAPSPSLPPSVLPASDTAPSSASWTEHLKNPWIVGGGALAALGLGALALRRWRQS